MTILFLDQFSDPGGAQQCLLDLFPAVLERGWKACFALPGAGPVIGAAKALGVSVEPLVCGPFQSGRKTPADLARFALQLPAISDQIRHLATTTAADLLYVNGPRLLAAVSRARRGLPPVLFHCHSHLPQRYAAWLAGRSLEKLGATVASCCQYVLKPLERYVAPPLRRVVYNGVRERMIGERDGVRNPPTIGLIGRISPEKGHADLLRAGRMLPDCRLVICGAPLFGDAEGAHYSERLRQMAQGLPVEFLGWRADIAPVLETVDVLAIPSVREPGLPRVLLEAFSAGLPVVAASSGGIPEVVTDGENGFLVEPGNPESLAAGVHRALNMPAIALRRLSESARQTWRERYTLERYQRQMIELIEQVAAQG